MCHINDLSSINTMKVSRRERIQARSATKQSFESKSTGYHPQEQRLGEEFYYDVQQSDLSF